MIIIIIKILKWKFVLFLMPFSKPKFSFSSYFVSLFRVMKDYVSELRSNVKYFAQKEPIKMNILRIFSAQVKTHQIFVIFETTNQFFGGGFCIKLQCHEIYILYDYLAEILYTLNKRILSKSKFGKTSCEQSRVWNVSFWWVPFAKII